MKNANTQNPSPKRTNVRRLCELALLMALILVMAYTPLGYLVVGPLSLSFLTIPVAIGAMLLGPSAGALLGVVFGLTSFFNMMQGKSVMGTALFAVSPARSFILAVVARLLCGLCAGLVYLAAKKLLKGKTKLCCAIGGIATPLLNTLFYMSALVLLFYNCEYVQNLVVSLGVTNPFSFVVVLVGFQGLLEAVVGCVISTAVTVPLLKYVHKEG